MEKLLEIVNTVLTNKGKETVSNLSPSDGLTSTLKMDSLDLAELTVRIEAEYDIDVFEDGLVLTVGQIMEKLEINA
jgi:acyl carrier protein